MVLLIENLHKFNGVRMVQLRKDVNFRLQRDLIVFVQGLLVEDFDGHALTCLLMDTFDNNSK